MQLLLILFFFQVLTTTVLRIFTLQSKICVRIMVSKKLYPKIKYEILPDFFIRLDHKQNATKKERKSKTLYVHVCMSRHILSEHFFCKIWTKIRIFKWSVIHFVPLVYYSKECIMYCRLKLYLLWMVFLWFKLWQIYFLVLYWGFIFLPNETYTFSLIADFPQITLPCMWHQYLLKNDI